MILEKLPIFVLQSAAHSGIDWTHSLLDSHSQVLIMPAFSFYRTIYEIESRRSIDLKKKNLEDISEIFSELFLNDKIYQVKRRKFIYNEKEKEIFKKNFYEYLSTNNINLYKKIFFGLHYAFSKLYKIDISKIKCIVIHEHVTWHFDKYEKFFNAKHILVFRNPKAAVAGSIYKLRQLNQIGIVNAFQFDHIILDMTVTFKIFKMNKKNFLILQNETMHSDFKGQLNNLCQWLDIKFENCLLNQTFLGKEWKGESSYLAWDEVEEKPDEEYYLEKNVESRWRKVLSKKDILIIETIFYDYMKKLNYQFDNRMSIFKKIEGYFLYFTLYLDQDTYAYSKMIMKIRNIIRKILILIFKHKVASLFKFK